MAERKVVNKLGRPSKLTPEVKRRFIEAIRAGSHYEPACQYAGIDYKTFRDWMQRGQGVHPARSSAQEYVDFAAEVMRAEAEGELQCIAAIKGATKEDWRPAAWMLERRHAERWSKSEKIEIMVQQQVESQVNLLFNAIAADPTIPHEAKQKMFEAAAKLNDKAAVAGSN